MEKEKTSPHRPTLYVMIALIVMFLIGIFLRWDYIKEEVTESVKRMFPTEETE